MPLPLNFEAKSITEFGNLIQVLFLENTTSSINYATVGVLQKLNTVLQNELLDAYELLEARISVLPFDVGALSYDSTACARYVEQHPVALAF